MRVKKMEDLPPHNRLFEMMAFSGTFLPVYDGINITYYKIYRQADITPPDGYKCHYIEYSPQGTPEPTELTGTAAKIMLMRELIKNFGVGGQVDSGINKNISAEIKSMYEPKEIPKVVKRSNYIEEKFIIQKLALC